MPTNPGFVARSLAYIFVFLMLANAAGLVVEYVAGYPYALGLVPLFDVGIEQNIPALFATLLLLTSAALFFALYRIGEASRYHRNVWLFLSLVFVFLGIDEFTALHERLNMPIKNAIPVSGYLYFAWVIPYSLATIIVAAIVAPAVWRLGQKYRLLFAAAGFTFLSGALGVELLGAKVFEAGGRHPTLNYRLLQSLEEALEFIGVIILIYTLLHLIRDRVDRIELRLS